MDLLTAVAVSMLPVSRLRAAAAFTGLREAMPPGEAVARVLERSGGPREGPDARAVVAAALDMAGAALAAGEARGYRVLTPFHPGYPALLACIPDPPPALWCRGVPSSLEAPCVAIVGSRSATPYALQIGRRLAAELAERGIVVVSGLARGVDSAGHEGALAAGGATIAVIGSGLDNVYPREHDHLADRIAAKGLVVSELAPGGKPLAEHFPLRNRIISGISLGVVVVEASEKSGSLITAGCALRQGRDVMAVPGSVLSGRNRGSHGLLKDGAKVVESADDILEDLGWTPSASASRPASGSRGVSTSDPLLSRMDIGEVYGLDDLVEITGTPASKLLPRLMELELLGHIEAPGGGRFVRPAAGRVT
jgi:DNA processing protein